MNVPVLRAVAFVLPITFTVLGVNAPPTDKSLFTSILPSTSNQSPPIYVLPLTYKPPFLPVISFVSITSEPRIGRTPFKISLPFASRGFRSVAVPLENDASLLYTTVPVLTIPLRVNNIP